MNLPPPLPRDQRTIDAEHLRLLAIFHFVLAGLSLVGLLFLVAHYLMFQAFFATAGAWSKQSIPMPPKEVFTIFKWMYVVFGLWGVASAALNLLAGIFIRARTHRVFCLVVAGTNCLHIPLGAALGVFTILVLIRETVREQFLA